LIPSIRHESKNSKELSLYRGEIAEPSDIKSAVKKLVAAFPDITEDYIIVLVERMIDKGFTKDRVIDAVNNCIDNIPYKRPSISDIVSFDRKIKLFTYEEMCEKCNQHYTSENFSMVEVDGRKRYYKK